MISTAARWHASQSTSRPWDFTTSYTQSRDEIDPGVTDASPWERRLNSWAGVEELRWFNDNLQALGQYEGSWIAIWGRNVAASGHSMEEVRDQVVARGIRDAVILRMPDDVSRREYFIG